MLSHHWYGSVQMRVDPWLKQLGERVQQLRGTEKQESFAARVGIARQTLSAIENGRSCNSEALAKILIKTGQNPAWLTDSLEPYGRAHRLLQDILEHAPKDAVEWITGNLETFHRAYVRPGGGR